MEELGSKKLDQGFQPRFSHSLYGSVAICPVGTTIVSLAALGCFEFESRADELDCFG
jgi:hypothetical protein